MRFPSMLVTWPFLIIAIASKPERSSDRPETAKAEPWPGQPFDAPMIFRDNVIQIFHLPLFGTMP
jgi:hypothetical protein